MTPLWAFIPGWLLVPVAVVGNGLVIFLITTRRNLRTTTNWFVLSLAVADLGVVAVWYPRASFCSIRDETCVKETVEIAFCIGSFCIYASVANLCVLTLDRYLAIVRPLRYVTFMTKKRVVLLISAAWSIATLDLVCNFLVLFILSGKPKQKIEHAHWVFAIAVSICACVFLLLATVRIFLVVRRIAKRNAALVAQLNFNHELRHGVAFKAPETASAKMIGIVVTVFLVCYLLETGIFIIRLDGSLRIPEIVLEIYFLLVLLNSAVNPVAYAFHKREIKRELKRLFRCNRKQVLRNSVVTEAERKAYELRPLRNRVEQA